MVAMGLARLDWSEQNAKKAVGLYQCDPNSDTMRGFDEYRKYDYRLRVIGCSAAGYQAFLDAPAPDGSQGRAFCVDQTGVVRISNDGTSTDCITKGTPWH
jgi:hypothetical protein